MPSVVFHMTVSYSICLFHVKVLSLNSSVYAHCYLYEKSLDQKTWYRVENFKSSSNFKVLERDKIILSIWLFSPLHFHAAVTAYIVVAWLTHGSSLRRTVCPWWPQGERSCWSPKQDCVTQSPPVWLPSWRVVLQSWFQHQTILREDKQLHNPLSLSKSEDYKAKFMSITISQKHFFLKMIDPLVSNYKYFKTRHVCLLAQSRISFSLSIIFRQDVGSLPINARRACRWMCTVKFSFFSHKSNVLLVFLSSLLFSPTTKTLYCK